MHPNSYVYQKWFGYFASSILHVKIELSTYYDGSSMQDAIILQ